MILHDDFRYIVLSDQLFNWGGLGGLLSGICMFFNDLNFLMYLGFSVGFFLFGSITSLYILVPSLYPAEIRTTGMGAGIGVGRIGAILSPTITGVLLDMGLQTSSLFVIFSLPMLIAMVAILFIRTDQINPAL